MTTDSPAPELPGADAIADQTDRVLRTVRSLTGADDLQSPSLCAGWTRDHVVNHIARNADALARVARAAVDGTSDTMYDSEQARTRDIEAGLGRAPAELERDLASGAERLAEETARLTPEVADVKVPRTPGGPPMRAGSVPQLRLRELVFHHVDLDAGFGFDDLDADLLSYFLADQVGRLRTHPHAPSLRIRTDEGDAFAIGDGTAYVTGSRAGVLLWLARQVTSGVRSDDLPTLPAGV